MRHPYTPVFRDFLTSSMWATDPATRCVWIWFLLMADPEGFVVGTVPGVAQQAGVTLEQAKLAIGLLENPDPYSSTPDFEGRRVIKVERGWHIVNFVAYRERAKLEAEKARKRTWAQKNRARQLPLPFPDVDAASTCVDSSETLDAPKPKPKPTLPSEGESSPLPPVGAPAGEFMPALGEALTTAARTRRIVCSLDGWEPSEELRSSALIAGVLKFDEHVARLRTGPIGGTRGVFEHELDGYIESMFGKWRTWEETDRAKDAQRQAAAASPSRFGQPRTLSSPLEPSASQRAFAERCGIDLAPILKGIQDDDIIGSLGFGRAKEMLGERITVAVKQKRQGEPITGKLTPEQRAKWGPVPPGGAIPEVA
jgi:hypothetical protein